jgi:LAGLIDADG endonuclease
MDNKEFAWVAGFLEGEGCFTVLKCNNKRFGLYQYPRVTCASTDLDALQRLQKYSGIGGISNPRQRGKDKPRWEWAASKSGQAVGLMKALYPYMGQRRRERIGEVLDIAGWSRIIPPATRPLDLFSWVVGYLEGEGAFFYMTLQQGKYGPYHYPRVGVGCTDQDVIERLPQYTGLGQITGPYDREPPQKTVWYWTITNKGDAASFMKAVHPHMCSRRQAKITEVLNHCERGVAYPSSYGHSQLEVIDLVPIEEDETGDRMLGAADEATLYATPVQIPSQPEKGRS